MTLIPALPYRRMAVAMPPPPTAFLGLKVLPLYGLLRGVGLIYAME